MTSTTMIQNNFPGGATVINHPTTMAGGSEQAINPIADVYTNPNTNINTSNGINTIAAYDNNTSKAEPVHATTPSVNKSGNLVERYRFRTLNDFLGNERAVRLLKNQLKHQVFNSVNIFVGKPGSGKTSAALVYAKSINCQRAKEVGIGQPCEVCPSCRAANSNGNPDIIEINAASNNGVDSAREIAELVKRKPLYNKIVIILDEWQMMTSNALTSLLTVFERASKSDATVSASDYLFIMPTTDIPTQHKAVLSRAQIIYFQPLSKPQLINKLREVCLTDGYAYEDEALELVYNHAKGGTREALTLLQTIAVYNNFNISKDATEDYISSSTSTLAPELFRSIHTLSVTQTTELINNYVQSVVIKESDFNDLATLILDTSSKSTPFMQDVYTQCLRTIRNERINFLRDPSSKVEENLILACRDIISTLKSNIAPAICHLISQGNRDFGELVLALNPDIRIEQGQLIFELDPPSVNANYIIAGLNSEFIMSVFSNYGAKSYRFRNIANSLCSSISRIHPQFGEFLLTLNPRTIIENGQIIFELNTPADINSVSSALSNESILSIFSQAGVTQYRFK